ncbi:CinA family protein [Pararhizobium haloflavum]|uniref:CinA family protein n=1 Tax=Pararhizobium haloflavum TaxID=2037914 RepID=UPI000C18A568|nr:CinA family protein [Pararhizobium haloflavum]
MNDADIQALAEDVVKRARERKVVLATAESCTGGMIAAAITDIAGASDIFDRGFVTYSNDAKKQMLDVKSETLGRHGAVSSQTAQEMAFGALSNSSADIAVSVTGIAGPGGGSPEKPVGLVYLAVSELDGKTHVVDHQFGDIGRDAIRRQTVGAALKAFLAAMDGD